jgi:hypothetical protein
VEVEEAPWGDEDEVPQIIIEACDDNEELIAKVMLQLTELMTSTHQIGKSYRAALEELSSEVSRMQLKLVPLEGHKHERDFRE